MFNTLLLLQVHLAAKSNDSYRGRHVVAPIECADGSKLSVQASENHYCSPRKGKGPWSEVEVGFPKRPDGAPYGDIPEWSEYVDTPGDVWGYVPVMLVVEFIDKHGGIKE